MNDALARMGEAFGRLVQSIQDGNEDARNHGEQDEWNQFIGMGQNTITNNQPLPPAPGPVLGAP